jgi:hypothetical protein
MQNTSGTFCRVVNVLAPISHAAASDNQTGFSREQFDQADFILALGALGAAATVDVKVQESDTLGSGYADITGAAFTQKTKSGTDMSGLIYHGSLDLRGRKKFLRTVTTVGAAASLMSIQCVLYDAKRSEACTVAQAGSEAAATLAVDFTV